MSILFNAWTAIDFDLNANFSMENSRVQSLYNNSVLSVESSLRLMVVVGVVVVVGVKGMQSVDYY